MALDGLLSRCFCLGAVAGLKHPATVTYAALHAERGVLRVVPPGEQNTAHNRQPRQNGVPDAGAQKLPAVWQRRSRRCGDGRIMFVRLHGLSDFPGFLRSLEDAHIAREEIGHQNLAAGIDRHVHPHRV